MGTYKKPDTPDISPDMIAELLAAQGGIPYHEGAYPGGMYAEDAENRIDAAMAEGFALIDRVLGADEDE